MTGIELPKLEDLTSGDVQMWAATASSFRVWTWDDIPWTQRMGEAIRWLEDVRKRRADEAERIARAEAWDVPAAPAFSYGA